MGYNPFKTHGRQKQQRAIFRACTRSSHPSHQHYSISERKKLSVYGNEILISGHPIYHEIKALNFRTNNIFMKKGQRTVSYRLPAFHV